MSKKDGGPAFPAPDLGKQDFGQRGAYPGMTLRDYFAAKAMAGVASTGEYDCAMIARRAYRFADAMLAARDKS